MAFTANLSHHRPVFAVIFRAWAVAVAAIALVAPSAVADTLGPANVVDVAVEKTGTEAFRFDVTIRSDDTGWDGYADAFDIVGSDGDVLGTRVLHHPHENEQPFTRSLTNVTIPVEVDRVTVRAHHSAEGHDGQVMAVDVPH